MSTRPDNEDVLRAGSHTFREFLSAVILNAQATADAVGLGATDFYGLNLLEVLGPLTAGQLADRTGLTTGAATRLIDRLERAGHVRRVADPADRRRVVVETVRRHDQDIDAALEPTRRHLAAVFTSYHPDQLAVLFDFFARATPALRDAAQEMHDNRR